MPVCNSYCVCDSLKFYKHEKLLLWAAGQLVKGAQQMTDYIYIYKVCGTAAVLGIILGLKSGDSWFTHADWTLSNNLGQVSTLQTYASTIKKNMIPVNDTVDDRRSCDAWSQIQDLWKSVVTNSRAEKD